MQDVSSHFESQGKKEILQVDVIMAIFIIWHNTNIQLNIFWEHINMKYDNYTHKIIK